MFKRYPKIRAQRYSDKKTAGGPTNFLTECVIYDNWPCAFGVR